MTRAEQSIMNFYSLALPESFYVYYLILCYSMEFLSKVLRILFHLLVEVRYLLLLESRLSNSMYCCIFSLDTPLFSVNLFFWCNQYFQSMIISWFYCCFSFLKLLCLLWWIDGLLWKMVFSMKKSCEVFFIEKTIFLQLFGEYSYKRSCT